MPALYELRSVTHSYGLAGHQVRALNGVDLEIEAGSLIAIAGPSGSGKTTLLNLMGLLDTAVAGSVCLDGRDVARLSERERTRLRCDRIGIIFQGIHLIPVLTARENVAYFLHKRGVAAAEVHRRVEAALEAVGVRPQAGQRPSEMSGGQRQRVAIARALVREPGVVLADEPTASLDRESAAAVMTLMRTLNRERGVTFCLASHDALVLAAVDRVVPLVDGRVES